MPNLVDIVEIAEALESKAVFLATDRCVVVRNRHSSCTKCADACPVDAVLAVNNVLTLDGGRCVSCGACTTVCPTEALIPLAPLDEDLAASAAETAASERKPAIPASVGRGSIRIMARALLTVESDVGAVGCLHRQFPTPALRTGRAPFVVHPALQKPWRTRVSSSI